MKLKRLAPLIALVPLLALLASTGCGAKVEEPKDQVKAMRKTFPKGGADTAEADKKAAAPDGYTSFAFATEGEPSSFIEAANTAVKANDHATAIFILANVNRRTNLNSSQLMAIHESMQVLAADLIRRADRGDVKAK